ncbi:MAG: isochorismate synthase [Halopseudomonas sp.]
MLTLDQAISEAVNALCQQLKAFQPDAARQYPYRLQQPLTVSGELDLTDWLASQRQFPKFFWRSRDQRFQTAALGIAAQYTGEQAFEQLATSKARQSKLRYYWLSGFDNSDSSPSEVAQQRLFLPQIELYQQHDQLYLSVTLSCAADLAEIETQLGRLQRVSPLNAPSLTVLQRHDRPNFDQWQQAISDAKRSFKEGHLQKVVLARQSQLECQQPLSFWSLFKRWQRASVNSYQIGFQPSADKGFISFTPERLFMRDGRTLCTEAVAATLPRSNDNQLAREQAQALLNDTKSRHEHDLVVVEIGAKLEALGVKLGQGCGTSLLKLVGLQHLHQPIQGQLPERDMDAQLLSTLHPTAAVGGLPAENARQFISQHEPFQRGWYAGCCGYIGPEKTELAVTIRSAEVDATRLTLYAGAGIVPQSDPLLEWQELEQKIALPLSLFDQQSCVDSDSLDPDAFNPSSLA